MTDGAADAPQLDLSFRRHPVQGTWLERRRFRWPYTIGRGFQRDAARPHLLHVIVQTVSGTIQADDRLRQRIHVAAGAAARIVTQGAAPVHRARDGSFAQDDVTLEVAADGWLEYLPEPRILFPDARLAQTVRVVLPPGAVALIADAFVTHDPLGKARPFARHESTLLLQRPDGTLLAADRFDLAGPPHGLGGFAAHGTLTLAVDRPADWRDAVSDEISAMLGGIDGVYGAACSLPNDAGLFVRVAATNGERLRGGLQEARRTLLRHLPHDAPRCNNRA